MSIEMKYFLTVSMVVFLPVLAMVGCGFLSRWSGGKLGNGSTFYNYTVMLLIMMGMILAAW